MMFFNIISVIFLQSSLLLFLVNSSSYAAAPLDPSLTILEQKVFAPLTACRGIREAKVKEKIVALTFDDGPSSNYTEQVLEILRLHNIKGTFFFIGSNVEKHPEVVKDAFAAGHVIGNHTYGHPHLNAMEGTDIMKELTKGGEAIHEAIGVYPLLFRPPYGACSLGSVRAANNAGLRTINWSAMVDDYNFRKTSSEKIAFGIIGQVKPGAIIGLHDGGGNRAKTVQALQTIIKILKGENYKFVTIPELLKIKAYTLKPKRLPSPPVKNPDKSHGGVAIHCHSETVEI